MFTRGSTESIHSAQWGAYQKSAFTGQIASALLTLTSVIALTVICAAHAQGVSITGSFQSIVTLASVGGSALAIFVVCSCLNYYAQKKIAQQEQLELLRSKDNEKNSASPQTKKVTADFDKEPIEFVKQVVIHPLMDAFKEAVESTVVADSVATSKSLEGKSKLVDEAFKEADELFDIFLDNPQIYVGELIRYFGPGKQPPSVALRRMISAFNSGDKEMLDKVRTEYKKIVKGSDFSDIANALKQKSNAELMTLLPELLKGHFSLADEKLEGLGQQVLDLIFEKTKTNQIALNALTQLKKQTGNKKFPKAVQKFLKLVLDEAQVSKKQFEEWNAVLIEHMLNTTFKSTVCSLFSMMARNIRILKLMFNKEMEKKELFTTLDETFLTSESGDCIKKKKLQEEMFRLQSVFNFDRKEAERIALIALPESDNRTYEQLCKEEKVIELCFEAHPTRTSELQKINADARVKNLGLKHGMRLVAVPVSISDHPFKAFKNHEGKIKFAAGLLKPFLPGLVKPKLVQMLPKMEGDHLRRFDALFKTVLELLIDPIYDGAIGNTKFRPIFEKVITTQGEALAESLEDLVRDKENLTFERIRDVWTTSVRKVAQEFNKRSK